MATAGRTLRVALVANTKNFRAGMMSAVRDAKGFQGKMSAVAMSMRGTLGPQMSMSNKPTSVSVSPSL